MQLHARCLEISYLIDNGMYGAWDLNLKWVDIFYLLRSYVQHNMPSVLLFYACCTDDIPKKILSYYNLRLSNHQVYKPLVQVDRNFLKKFQILIQSGFYPHSPELRTKPVHFRLEKVRNNQA